MSAHKDIAKMIKRPDSFQKMAVKALKSLVDHSRIVVAVLGGLLFVVLVAAAIQYYSTSKVSGRQLALAEVEREYNQRTAVIEKKLRDISDQIDRLSKQTEGPAAIESAAKKAELETQAKALKPDYKGLEPKYEVFARQFPDTNEAAIALSKAAQIHLTAKRLPEAQANLEQIVTAPKIAQYFKASAYFTLVNIYTTQGKLDEALKASEQLLALVPTDVVPRAKLLKARVLIAKKDKEAAKKELDAVIKDHPTSPAVQTAKSLKVAESL